MCIRDRSGGAATLDISQYSFTGLKSGFIFYFFGYVFGSFFAVDGLDLSLIHI